MAGVVVVGACAVSAGVHRRPAPEPFANAREEARQELLGDPREHVRHYENVLLDGVVLAVAGAVPDRFS
jgi:hypothetical protein